MKKTVLACLLLLVGHAAFGESIEVNSNDSKYDFSISDEGITELDSFDLSELEQSLIPLTPNPHKVKKNKLSRQLLKGAIYGATLAAGIFLGTSVFEATLGQSALLTFFGAGVYYVAGKLADQAEHLIDHRDSKSTEAALKFELRDSSDDEVKELERRLNQPIIRNTDDVLVDTFTEPLKKIMEQLESTRSPEES